MPFDSHLSEWPFGEANGVECAMQMGVLLGVECSLLHFILITMQTCTTVFLVTFSINMV